MNYFKYEQEKNKKKHSRRQEKQYGKYLKEKKSEDGKRLKSYWKRVENFMIQVRVPISNPQMVENPVVVNDFSKSDHHQHKFRDEDPSKFRGNALFIIQGFKNRDPKKMRNVRLLLLPVILLFDAGYILDALINPETAISRFLLLLR